MCSDLVETTDVMLDVDEQDIVDSFERGEWKTVDNFDEQARLAQQTASHSLKKDARVNICISSHDLLRLKQQAAYKGLPYQTFIASVLREYATGHYFQGR